MVEAEAPNKDQTQKQEQATLQQQSSTLSPYGQPQLENDTTYITDPYNARSNNLACQMRPESFGETPNATPSVDLKFNVVLPRLRTPILRPRRRCKSSEHVERMK
jgi:hypothetical protein